MKKALTLMLVLFLTNLLFLSTIPAWGISPPAEITVEQSKSTADAPSAPQEVIVKFKAQASEKTAESVVKSKKDEITGKIDELKIKKVKVAKGEDISEAIEEYEGNPNVEFAEPNYKRSLLLAPNDTYYTSQWSHSRISSSQGWDINTGSSSTTIAIVDTGVDYTHPDLAAKVILGYDFFNDDSDPMDGHGHGTHCAGIAAAVTNNNQGIAGVSWESKILAVKVLSDSGYGYDYQVAQGITYAADNGADVISLSLGGSSYSQTLKDAVDYAYARGCVIVAAVGNTGKYGVIYPAAYPHVVGVAATTSSDVRASYSTYGPEVDVAAPGSSILSTYPGSSYAYMSGTSMATPHVAGLAALVLSVKGSLSPGEVELTMERTAADLGSLGRDDYYGYGRIDVAQTLQATADPNFNFTIYSPASTPNRMTSDSIIYVPNVIVYNTSSVTWGTNYFLGYHWENANGQMVIWDNRGRAYMPTNIPPGYNRTMTVPVITPSTPGNYKLVWDMAEDGVAWFSQKGYPCYYQNVQIVDRDYWADYTSKTKTLTLPANQTVSIPNYYIISGNPSAAAWQAAVPGSNPPQPGGGCYFLGYHWEDATTGKIVVWDDGTRNWVPWDIPSLYTITFYPQVKTPNQPGTYKLVWDMAREGVGFFSQLSGVPCKYTSVTVE